MAGFTTEQLLEIAEKETCHFINPEDREDAKQEFILGVLEAQERGDPEQKGYRTYLWSYGRGRVLTFLSKQEKYNYRQNRHLNIHDTDAEESPISLSENMISDAEKPGDAWEKCTQIDALKTAINQLDDRKKQILQEYYSDEKSLAEIGTSLNLSRERIRQLKRDACDELKTLLA